MANPNIVSVNSIFGNTTGIALTTTLTTVLLANRIKKRRFLVFEFRFF